MSPPRFDLVDGPRFGRVERLRGSGRWVGTRRFYSRQLEREKVRYVQNRRPNGNEAPGKDSFTFVASASGDEDDDEEVNREEKELHEFKIQFVTSSLAAVRNVPLRLVNVQETVITDTHLLYRAGGSSSDDDEDGSIVFELTRAPARGSLVLTPVGGAAAAGGDEGDRRQQQQQQQPARKLKVGSRFSQVDLLAGHLKYR